MYWRLFVLLTKHYKIHFFFNKIDNLEIFIFTLSFILFGAVFCGIISLLILAIMSFEDEKYKRVLPPLSLLTDKEKRELMSKLKELDFFPEKNIAA